MTPNEAQVYLIKFMTNITITDIISIIQTIGIFIAAFLAWRIGIRQNEINKHISDIQDYVETFVMPSCNYATDDKGNRKLLGCGLIVKNASSYPIYLNRYTLNGVANSTGNTPIPPSSENWYSIGISSDVQRKGELVLELEFEDYLGNKYTSKHFGKFENMYWNVHSEKRVKML